MCSSSNIERNNCKLLCNNGNNNITSSANSLNTNTTISSTSTTNTTTTTTTTSSTSTINNNNSSSTTTYSNIKRNITRSSRSRNQQYYQQQLHQQQSQQQQQQRKMSRKSDDPVFNVKFVQLVEDHPCLWNSTLPAYSKKEEIQKAWQDVANETKDTVRNCRERWRTIRSSFLRSLKLSGTTTGRGKRKYYLFKYLQFLIPYTKTRLKNGASLMTARKVCLPPMTRINHMPLPVVSSDDTKDSTTSELAIAEEDVLVSLHEGGSAQQTQQQTQQQQLTQQTPLPQPLPLQLQPRLMAIKMEQGANSPPETQQQQQQQQHQTQTQSHSQLDQQRQSAAASSINGFLATSLATAAAAGSSSAVLAASSTQQRSPSNVDLSAFAEWIKSKNDQHRHCLMPSTPDADQSFLNSLHPYLKEMSGKQNRRFRQKVVALVDAILDNAD